MPNQPLKKSDQILIERLVTKQSATIAPARSTLSKAAINYRDFLIALQQAQSQKEKVEVIETTKDINEDANKNSNEDANKDINKDDAKNDTKNDTNEKGDDKEKNDKADEGENKDKHIISVCPLSRLEHAKNQVISGLKLHDLEVRKVSLGCKAAVSELQYYEVVANKTNQSILQIKKEIEALRRKLNHEKVVRKNREEYEGLAKQAGKRSPALVTKRKLEQVHSDIKELEIDRRNTNERIEMRRKQFQGLMQNIFDLKNSLDEEDTRENIKRDIKERIDKESTDSEGLYEGL